MKNNEKILKIGNTIFSTNAPDQLINLLSAFNENNFQSVIINCGFYCENITEFFEICLN
jgi:hypothetical protein